MKLTIENITRNKGKIMIAVYDREETFMDEARQVFGTVIPLQETGELTVDIPDLAFGTYAIAVYHDINGNGKLDKNFLGIPQEPYGFSNNPAVKWSPPGFSDAAFRYSADQPSVRIRLNYWKDMNKG